MIVNNNNNNNSNASDDDGSSQRRDPTYLRDNTNWTVVNHSALSPPPINVFRLVCCLPSLYLSIYL